MTFWSIARLVVILSVAGLSLLALQQCWTDARIPSRDRWLFTLLILGLPGFGAFVFFRWQKDLDDVDSRLRLRSRKGRRHR